VTHQMVEAALRQAGYRLIESIDEIDHSHFAFSAARRAPPSPPPRSFAVARPRSMPAGQRLLADEHGVLLVDVAAGTSGSLAESQTERSQAGTKLTSAARSGPRTKGENP
jgi:hypothetical protein